MNPAIKIAVITSALLGLAAGAAFGVRQGVMLGEIMESVQTTAAEVVPSDFSALQFQYADADHAREAVLFEIRTLEQLQSLAPDSSVTGRLAFAFARLGMVDEVAGQSAAAAAAFDQARTWVRMSRRGADLTDEQLRDVVRRLDHSREKYSL